MPPASPRADKIVIPHLVTRTVSGVSRQRERSSALHEQYVHATTEELPSAVRRRDSLAYLFLCSMILDRKICQIWPVHRNMQSLGWSRARSAPTLQNQQMDTNRVI